MEARVCLKYFVNDCSPTQILLQQIFRISCMTSSFKILCKNDKLFWNVVFSLKFDITPGTDRSPPNLSFSVFNFTSFFVTSSAYNFSSPYPISTNETSFCYLEKANSFKYEFVHLDFIFEFLTSSLISEIIYSVCNF